MFKIIFLCAGNTCRSPMAEVTFRKYAKERNLPADVKSAGLLAFVGDEATENAKKAVEEMGLNLSDHRAKKLSVYDVEECDFIVPVTRELLGGLTGIDKSKIILPEKDISDPYGKDEKAYRECLAEISAFTEKLADRLSEIKVRPMKEKDVRDVAKIEKQCFSKPWSEDGIRAELTNENAHFFVATKLEAVCGYIGMHIILDECYIANVAVSPKWQKSHIGLALAQRAVATAEEKGCRFVSLEVRKSNKPAISLYEKCGFVPMGERKGFYSEPTEDALIMTKELED